MSRRALLGSTAVIPSFREASVVADRGERPINRPFHAVFASSGERDETMDTQLPIGVHEFGCDLPFGRDRHFELSELWTPFDLVARPPELGQRVGGRVGTESEPVPAGATSDASSVCRP